MAFADAPIDDAIAVPIDSRDPVAKRLPKLKAGFKWIRWLSDLVIEIDEKPARKAHVRLTGRTAAIATTAIPLGDVPPGAWRISYQVRVSTPATTSSEVRVTITWTQGAVTQTQQGTLLNGNTTTTREGNTFVIRPGAATAISYSTSYASVGATAMAYEIDVVAEQLALDD